MYRLVILLFLMMMPLRVFAQDSDPIKALIQNSLVDTCERLNKPNSSPCRLNQKKIQKAEIPPAMIEENKEVSLPRCNPNRDDVPKLISMKSSNDQDVPVSSLSPEEAQEVFNHFSKQGSRYILTNSWMAQRACAQRAQLMAADLLKDCKIRSGKIFVRPSRSALTLWMGRNVLEVSAKGKQYSWDNFHVANIIYVEENGKSKPYVLDPLLFDGPAPLEKWEALVKTNDPGASSTLSSGSVYKFTDVYEDDPQRAPAAYQAQKDLDELRVLYRRMQRP